MISRRLGCLSPLALISAIITLTILLFVRMTSGSLMFNPGALNSQAGSMRGGIESHFEIGRDCAKCHPAFWSAQTMSVLCLDCHVEIQGQINNPPSLHAVLFQDKFPACQSCHTEHHGPDAALTLWDRFGFDHEATGFSLAGHQTRADGFAFTCENCHAGVFSEFDLQGCTDCHLSIDHTFMTAHSLDFDGACLSCHDGADRYGEFDHNQQSFVLIGAHQQVSCSGCHLGDSTIAELQDTPTECQACHLKDDAHNGRFGEQCGVCHSPAAWSPADFDHNLADFPLEGKHIDVPCEDCHTIGFQGTQTDCYSCHASDDAHERAFGTACETCHNPSDWKDVTFDHNLAAFPLNGAHVNVACTECHLNAVFKGTFHECAECHAEPAYHLNLFTAQPCSDCHTTTAWRPATFDEPHPFPMDHGGRINLCTECHPSTLAQWACYTCHDQAEIASEHIKEGISNFTDCLGCHPTGLKEESGGGGDND